MEIKLKGRAIPRNEQGDAEFKLLGGHPEYNPTHSAPETVLGTFTEDEVVELVNRALYQLEYQLAAHRKYGARKRAEEKQLREALKAKGVDPKSERVQKELKGE